MNKFIFTSFWRKENQSVWVNGGNSRSSSWFTSDWKIIWFNFIYLKTWDQFKERCGCEIVEAPQLLLEFQRVHPHRFMKRLDKTMQQNLSLNLFKTRKFAQLQNTKSFFCLTENFKNPAISCWNLLSKHGDFQGSQRKEHRKETLQISTMLFWILSSRSIVDKNLMATASNASFGHSYITHIILCLTMSLQPTNPYSSNAEHFQVDK